MEPVIALHGPRSLGKSTVLRSFAFAAGGSVLDLDDVQVREAVIGILASIVAGSAPICVDEYQTRSRRCGCAEGQAQPSV